MNFINEHMSSNFYSRQLVLGDSWRIDNIKRIKVAGHVFINEIHSVVLGDSQNRLPYGSVPDPFPSSKKRERVGNARLMRMKLSDYLTG